MKKRILSSMLVFVVTWVAVGAFDCGCAYAYPDTVSAKKIVEASESMDCHHSESSQSKKTDEACCSGCKLESKAPIPTSVQITGSNLSHAVSEVPNLSHSDIAVFSSAVFSSSKAKRYFVTYGHVMPFFDTPIYLAVQSFLI